MQHTEVPRPGVKAELQLLAYATNTRTQDTSCIFNLLPSSQQCQILNPLREARDQTHILMDTHQAHPHWATMGMPTFNLYSALDCVFTLWNMDLFHSMNLKHCKLKKPPKPCPIRPLSVFSLCIHQHGFGYRKQTFWLRLTWTRRKFTVL